MSILLVLSAIPLLLLVLLVVIVYRTITVTRRYSRMPQVQKKEKITYISLTDDMIKRFQKSINFMTVAYSSTNINLDELAKYSNYLQKAYPIVHSSSYVSRTEINEYSLLYQVTGSDPSLTPYLFSAHMDVVPAEDPDGKWDAKPFEASIVDGYIYGRGTLDFKNGVNGVLEALEYALSNNFRPRRSFFMAFGHDEEVGGKQGAMKIAEYMSTVLGVKKLEFVIDEGTHILYNAVKGVNLPFAMVGVTEKGFVQLELSVTMDTGHSSMPMGESSIGILAKAIHRIESNPFPSMLKSGSVDSKFLESLSPQAVLPIRVVLCNIWLFAPLLNYIFSKKPGTNAVIRTISSITAFHAGVKDNVIPPSASALINHRIHAQQTVQEVIDYDRRIIADDRVKIRAGNSMESHPIASHDLTSFGYQVVSASIKQLFPKMLVAPGVMVANSDSKAYLPFTQSVYRFAITRSYPPDLERFHGYNERISITNYEETINYYYNIIMYADDPELVFQN